jgi:hypothetical protein
MYDGKSPRGFRVSVSNPSLLFFRIRFRRPSLFFYVYTRKVGTFIYKIIYNMVHCPFLPGLNFTDPETLKSRLLDLDTATLQTLRDRLQIMVSGARFLEIQMHLLGFHGRGVQEETRHLVDTYVGEVDTYVGELFAQQRWERELERPRRPDMKRRPEEESWLEANHDSTKKSALSIQARFAKERAAREKATARREKIEANKRIEQGLAEREAKQLLELELDAQMLRRREAAPGFSELSEFARDRERRATAHREHMQRAEEREAEELRKQYAEQALRRW